MDAAIRRLRPTVQQLPRGKHPSAVRYPAPFRDAVTTLAADARGAWSVPGACRARGRDFIPDAGRSSKTAAEDKVPVADHSRRGSDRHAERARTNVGDQNSKAYINAVGDGEVLSFR